MIKLFSHPVAMKHEAGPGHPESPIRIESIEKALREQALPFVERHDAPLATLEQIALVHPEPYASGILDEVPQSGIIRLDPDTAMNSYSGEAALRAAGGVCAGVDAVVSGDCQRSFTLMRPPGHHAEPDKAMGFCLFNQIAVGAMHARSNHDLDRVAIVDFDVHHGNGTQAAFWNNPTVFYASSHQWPLFPGSGQPSERGAFSNVLNVTFGAGTDGPIWRKKIERTMLPAIEAFSPELLLLSAGFDAHELDPLASMLLNEEDFSWITGRLVEIADASCGGRIVACLEGGYHPKALARSFIAHLEALNQQSD